MCLMFVNTQKGIYHGNRRYYALMTLKFMKGLLLKWMNNLDENKTSTVFMLLI